MTKYKLFEEAFVPFWYAYTEKIKIPAKTNKNFPISFFKIFEEKAPEHPKLNNCGRPDNFWFDNLCWFTLADMIEVCLDVFAGAMRRKTQAEYFAWYIYSYLSYNYPSLAQLTSIFLYGKVMEPYLVSLNCASPSQNVNCLRSYARRERRFYESEADSEFVNILVRWKLFIYTVYAAEVDLRRFTGLRKSDPDMALPYWKTIVRNARLSKTSSKEKLDIVYRYLDTALPDECRDRIDSITISGHTFILL